MSGQIIGLMSLMVRLLVKIMIFNSLICGDDGHTIPGRDYSGVYNAI